MIPNVFSSPVPIASHQVKQAQAQGQSSNQGSTSSSSQSQQSSSTTSKVVDLITDRVHTTSAEINVPVNAETGQRPHPGGCGPMTADESSMGVSWGSSGGQHGSGVEDYSRSVSSFPISSQQIQSFSCGEQQQQQSTNMGQQEMYLNTPEMQQGRHSQPPPTSSPYAEPRPQNDIQRSNSH